MRYCACSHRLYNEGENMSLTTHPYRYFSDKRKFLSVWKKTLTALRNDKIECVYGIWDIIAGRWFEDGPMLVKLSKDIISVKVHSEKYLAIGVNDILPEDKPVWFDETQKDEIKGLDWTEDLEWREYDAVKGSFGNAVCEIELIEADSAYGLLGLSFLLKGGGKLCLEDIGDVISASYKQ